MAAYDVADDGFLNTAAFLGPTAAAQQPLSFCKFGSEFFLVMNIDGSTIEVWHYAGGVRTVYSPTFAPLLRDNIAIRTDGTNVWLVYWTRPVITNPYSPPDGATINPFVPTVDLWNGAGFTNLGNDFSSINNYGHSGENNGLVSRFSACACDAEIGALYIMWAENGYSMIHGRPAGGQDAYENVNVTKFDASGYVSTATLYHEFQLGPGYTSPFIPPVYSSRLFVTNASGAPVAFYGHPAVVDTAFRTITYTEDLEMWDVNSVAILQTAVGSSLDPFVNQLTPTTTYRIGGTRFPDGTGLTKVVVPWAQSAEASGVIVLLVSVPEDGSGGFTLIDNSASEGHVQTSYSDVVDDGENIWLGAARGATGAIVQFHRVCPAWESWQANPVALIAGTDLEMEIDGDTIYAIGREIGSSPPKFGPLSLPILRDFVQCGGGIHIKTQLRH